jgi:hypothetical protein
MPVLFPKALLATRRNTYAVFGFRPATDAETAVTLVPEPASTTGVFEPYALVLPYSNQ